MPRYCLVSQSGYRGPGIRTKAAARRELAAEVRDGLRACRRRYRRCTAVGTAREGDVQIRIGGRDGYHLWNRWLISSRC